MQDKNNDIAINDIALAGSLLLVSVLSGLYIDAGRPDTIEPSMWWHWVLICTPAVLVAIRRQNPSVIAALASAAQAGIWISNLPEVLLPVVVVLYTAAADGGRTGLRTAIGASAALTVLTAVGIGVADDVTLYQLPLVALTCGTAIALGVNSARQRVLAADLATAATQARILAAQERDEAIADERSHIGRELHDIVGHALSVIAVQAESADRVAASQPEVAQSAVRDIASAARAALSDTRRVLVGLQRSSAAELTPPPDLAATRQLVKQLTASGVDVTLTESGCSEHDPSPIIAGSAYRILQESLTNAIKHGGHGTQIRASIVCHLGELAIEVVSTTDGSAVDYHAETGTGLAGMAERAEVLGGTFHAGQRGNTFVVSATLPNYDRTNYDRTRQP